MRGPTAEILYAEQRWCLHCRYCSSYWSIILLFAKPKLSLKSG